MVDWSAVWVFLGDRMQEWIDALITWDFFNVSLWQVVVVFVVATALELMIGALMRHKAAEK